MSAICLRAVRVCGTDRRSPRKESVVFEGEGWEEVEPSAVHCLRIKEEEGANGEEERRGEESERARSGGREGERVGFEEVLFPWYTPLSPSALYAMSGTETEQTPLSLYVHATPCPVLTYSTLRYLSTCTLRHVRY
eukprot:723164-Rhodomonas_salina.2